MSDQSMRRALLRGLGWGLVASLLGSLIFGLTMSPAVILAMRVVGAASRSTTYHGPDSILGLVGEALQEGIFGIAALIAEALFSSLLTSVVSMAVSVIPGAVNGAVLSLLIHFLAARAPSPSRTGAKLGVLVGGITGLLMDVVILRWYTRNTYGTLWSDLLLPAFVICLIATVASGLVGWRLGLAYQSNSQFTESGPS